MIELTGASGAGASLKANLKWSVPNYLAGSSLAVLLNLLLANQNVILLALAAPFVYLVHLAYRTRTEKVEEERRHSQQTADLYLGVIKALVRAVEAKDENTEEHLQRVEHYSVGIARILGLPEGEIEALRAASVLHDIGKLAVPEYILNKPGRLTSEEMEVMKLHPGKGAEILGAVPFPFPLAPVVRHHHERWDGNGYPDGLRGEEIPIGARILTAVDCFDAITTDRPYRKAVTRDEAFQFLRDQSGKMFDPEVVRVLLLHAEELEAEVLRLSPLPDGIDRQEIMALDASGPAHPPESAETPKPPPVADNEASALAEIARVVELDLEPVDRLHLLSAKIQPLVPHRCLVLYRPDEAHHRITAGEAAGHCSRRILGHSIAIGERMSGWSAHNRRPYVGRLHRNPLERDGSRSDLEELAGDPEIASLVSAVVAPVEWNSQLSCVLALYGDASCELDDAEAARRIEAIAVEIAEPVSRFRKTPAQDTPAAPRLS